MHAHNDCVGHVLECPTQKGVLGHKVYGRVHVDPWMDTVAQRSKSGLCFGIVRALCATTKQLLMLRITSGARC